MWGWSCQLVPHFCCAKFSEWSPSQTFTFTQIDLPAWKIKIIPTYCLPHVCGQSTELKNMEVLLQHGGKLRLEQLKSDDRYTVLLSGLPDTTSILPAGAVIGNSEN